jgi:hypothetical protein
MFRIITVPSSLPSRITPVRILLSCIYILP